MPPSLPRLVLASGSPRRRELLAGLGVDFEVRPADLDETMLAGESPREHVARLAREKSAARAESGELVLAADTVVLLDGGVLGKPDGEEEARAMLRRITGRDHTVLTGVCLWDPERRRRAETVESSEVTIGPMTAEQIAWYVDTGEPMDKAGSYAIQGLGTLFVEGIDGNYTNVVGLPLPAMRRLFVELGYRLLDFRA